MYRPVPRIVVLTHFPSPYQVELFDAIAQLLEGCFAVYYLHRSDATRRWNSSKPKHHAIFIGDSPSHLSRAHQDFRTAELAIFNYYNERVAAELIRIRIGSGLPWCFWGERPGFEHPLLGRIARLWRLRGLHARRIPIWGIGRFAVEGYRAEFGSDRTYETIPYYSDLDRFSSLSLASRPANPARVVLFSGSLTKRKGVDLLARAFANVARSYPKLRLVIMGVGPERKAMEEALQACARQVQFLNFVDWTDLPEVYSRANILCVPSRYDGWGLVVPEGLAAGLPVIATDRMGAAIDLIESGYNGWMVQAGDLTALEKVIQTSAGLPDEQLMQMSTAARRSIQEHTLSSGASRFVAASNRVVSGWPEL